MKPRFLSIASQSTAAAPAARGTACAAGGPENSLSPTPAGFAPLMLIYAIKWFSLCRKAPAIGSDRRHDRLDCCQRGTDRFGGGVTSYRTRLRSWLGTSGCLSCSSRAAAGRCHHQTDCWRTGTVAAGLHRGLVADTVPTFGGMPNNVPPVRGTVEYDATEEAARIKLK